jgi:hypothetical protein
VIQPGVIQAVEEKSKTAALTEAAVGAVAAPQGSPQSSTRDPLLEISRSNGGEYHIVLTARSRESLPAALWNSSYFIFLGEAGSAKTQSQSG